MNKVPVPEKSSVLLICFYLLSGFSMGLGCLHIASPIFPIFSLNDLLTKGVLIIAGLTMLAVCLLSSWRDIKNGRKHGWGL